MTKIEKQKLVKILEMIDEKIEEQNDVKESFSYKSDSTEIILRRVLEEGELLGMIKVRDYLIGKLKEEFES